jgi:hypothetical protein
LEKPFKTLHSFFVVNELPAISLLNPALNARSDFCILFDHTHYGQFD